MKKGKGTFILTHREQEEILAKRRMAKLPKVIFVKERICVMLLAQS